MMFTPSFHDGAVSNAPSEHSTYAGVAELADARDLKSRETHLSYRFDPGRRHYKQQKVIERMAFFVSLDFWFENIV